MLRTVADHRDVRVLLRPERPREHEHLGVAMPARRQSLPRPATHQVRVELRRERGEVDIRVHRDPVVLARGACDVAIQAGCDHVPDSSHEGPPGRVWVLAQRRVPGAY